MREGWETTKALELLALHTKVIMEQTLKELNTEVAKKVISS